MPSNKKSNRRRVRSRRRNMFMGSRNIFAVVLAGKTVTATADQCSFPSDRPIRVTRISGTITVSTGLSGLTEIVLYNQGQTQLCTTGVLSIGQVPLKFNLNAPAKSDMWIDPGRSQVKDLKIFHVDHPCVSKTMEGNIVCVNLTIFYVAGRELVSDSCPTLTSDGLDSSFEMLRLH